MLYDDILEHVGEFGPYQRVMYILLSLVNFPTCFQNMAMTLYAAKMDHWCVIPGLANFTHDQQRQIGIPFSDDDSNEYSQCTFYDLPYNNYTQEELVNWNRTLMIPENTPMIDCTSGWVYDQTTFESTLVSEFDLVCGKSGQVSLIQTIYMCGFLLGCLTFGFIADKIGRYKSLVIANIVQVVCPVAATFMPVYPAYVVLRFFCGMGSAGGITTLFVLMSELIGRRYRMRTVLMSKCFYSIAYMIQPGMAYLIRNHKTLQLAVALVPVALWISFAVLPESPRWLILEGRDEEATKILRKMAETNGVSLPEKLNLEENRARNEVAILGRNPNIGDLFRSKGLRRVTLNSWFNWLVTSLVYYGLSLGVDMLPGSIFMNTFLAGAMEIPAMIVLVLISDKCGRRWTNAGTLFGSGLCCLLCMAFIDRSDMQNAAIAVLMLGKFFSAGSFGVIYLYATELFPTLVRTVGLGSCSMIGRIGSLVQPQVNRLELFWMPAPFLVFGVLSVLSGIFALFLPETLGKKLPDTLEEGEKFAINITFRMKSKPKSKTKGIEEGFHNDGYSNDESYPTKSDISKMNGNLSNGFDDIKTKWEDESNNKEVTKQDTLVTKQDTLVACC